MSVMTPEEIASHNNFNGVYGFQPTQVFKWLLNSPCKTTFLLCGNRFGKGECICTESLINTPNGDFTMGFLYDQGKPFDVYAWDGKKKVITKASAPFKKEGLHKCYRITMSDGQWVECSGGHRILTASGEFCSVSSIHDSFLLDHQNKHVSDLSTSGRFVSEPYQSTHVLNGRNFVETQSDCRDDCSVDSRLYDDTPLMEKGNDQVSVPSQVCVQPHNVFLLYGDVLGCIYTNSYQLKHDLLSTLDDLRRNVGQFFEFLISVFCTMLLQFQYAHQVVGQPPVALFHQPQSLPLNVPRVPLSGSLAYSPPLCFNGNKIVSIKPIPSQEVYDVTVPIHHNYFAGDMVHHNSVVMDWILRLWNKHPQPWKNILPGDELRTLRIACATLPTDKDGEVKNTIYPILKRRMPLNWVNWAKDDITVRNPVIKVRNPLIAGNKPVNLEFVSYGQETMRQAGVPRRAIIQDEESGQDFFEEQQARTMDTGGDMIVAFTPIPGQIGWMFDSLYERASVIYRTPLVRERFKLRYGEDYPECQKIKGKDDICVIMGATDDNPFFDSLAKEIGVREGRELTKSQYLDEFFRDRYGEDEELIDARRYGIFKQLSGKVHKSFHSVHCISGQKYFPMGLPHDWFHVRLIDYHQKNPWAVVWLARSPANEIFVYRDAAFVPGRIQTYDIVSAMVDMSGDYKFKRNLIDPLAETTQNNTGFTTVQDLNRLFREFASEGRGTGGYWATWDTKGTIGREEMTKRLLNARKVGVPFNNTIVENGRSIQLPTIWFLTEAQRTIEAMGKWRYEEWMSNDALQRNDEKEKPQQKFSHFPIAIECALKDNWISRPMTWDKPAEPRERKEYFHSGRR